VKVAAVQMEARLADIDYNLERAEALLERAFAKGCELVVLPEFFTSGVAFHPDMRRVALPLEGPALALMESAARRHGGWVGGSFICSREADAYNTWVLVSPDGGRWTHDKDQPTMWENCWYVGGSDDGVLDTGGPLGTVGAAMCWELVRTRTVHRLRGKVDLLVGGSCWWDVPDRAIPIPGKHRASERNMQIMIDTPARMARLIGAPVVHAAHAGSFRAGMPMLPGFPYRSSFLGEAQVVDASGRVLARLRRQDGEGLAVADIEPGRGTPVEEPPAGFWIPALPWLIRMVWQYQNMHGRFYYTRHRDSLAPILH
jgi:N-carbamoylputrescine amidase